MAWDSVPWFVGGGAQHSPEVARAFAFAATSGASGVATATDLSVAPLATPGASVRVLPGVALILNASTGGEEQTYTARLPQEDTVAIAATDSSGSRNDLVIARVEDPFMAGEPWQQPADVTVGPYVYTRVLSNVPASAIASPQAAADYVEAQGFSAIPLAGISLPASTATVTSGDIVDLRTVADPRSKRDIENIPSTGTPAVGAVNALTSSTYGTWPAAATVSVYIPKWATKAHIRADVVQYVVKGGNTTGTLRANLGGLVTQVTSFDENYSGNAFRNALTIAGTVDIPANLRGTTQTFKVEGRRSQNTGYIDADAYTTSLLDVTFAEEI